MNCVWNTFPKVMDLVTSQNDEVEFTALIEDTICIKMNMKSEEGLGEFLKLAYMATIYW